MLVVKQENTMNNSIPIIVKLAIFGSIICAETLIVLFVSTDQKHPT